jgi:hypothetical protein
VVLVRASVRVPFRPCSWHAEHEGCQCKQQPKVSTTFSVACAWSCRQLARSHLETTAGALYQRVRANRLLIPPIKTAEVICGPAFWERAKVTVMSARNAMLGRIRQGTAGGDCFSALGSGGLSSGEYTKTKYAIVCGHQGQAEQV